MNILYCFITHQRNIFNSFPRIVDMMQSLDIKDYLLCYGGVRSEYDANNKILQIMSNDYYEGLPEKVVKMFNFISKHNELNKFSHYIKLDDDITIMQQVNNITDDYCGIIYSPSNMNRVYHIGRCSKDSKFNNMTFEGEAAKSWCLGGNGYVLSNKAMNIVSQDTDYYNEIYEDMYVAKILKRNNIEPKDFPHIRDYLSSPHH